MKQNFLKVSSTILCVGLLSNYSLANSQSSLTCPDKYIAKVTSINEVQSSGFQKEEINLEVIQKIKGSAFDTKKLQILKGGIVEFVVGQTYTVQTRENWLCDASSVSSK